MKNNKFLKEKIILSYLLIIITVFYIILHFYRINIDQLQFKDTIKTIIFLSIISIIFMSIINIIIKNHYSSAVITSLYFILFFSYYNILMAILYNQLFGFVYGRSQFLLPAYIFIYILLFLIHKIYTKKVFNFTLLTIFILLFFEIFQIQKTIDRYFHNYTPSEHNKFNYEFDYKAVQDKPDIYYIVLDEYGRKDTLKEYYNFDNSKFINQLENRGFFVADKSTSNYNSTKLTFPSVFNMNYINFLKDENNIYSTDVEPLIDLFYQNKVSYFLNELGYYYIHIGSGINITNNNIFVNKHQYFGILGFFSSFLIDLTPIRLLKKYITAEDLRIRIIKTIEFLSDIPSKNKFTEEKPLFVFAHIISPHFPYIFDRDGKRIYHDFDHLNPSSEKKYYIEELLYLNDLIIDLIDNIIAYSKNPVIIIQADHGPPGSVIRPQKERFEILNAFYFTDKDYSILYNEISLVNTWRVIFNHIFNQNFEILEDKMYWSGIHFYDFQPFKIKAK